jgi:hypothetical protein
MATAKMVPLEAAKRPTIALQSSRTWGSSEECALKNLDERAPEYVPKSSNIKRPLDTALAGFSPKPHLRTDDTGTAWRRFRLILHKGGLGLCVLIAWKFPGTPKNHNG